MNREREHITEGGGPQKEGGGPLFTVVIPVYNRPKLVSKAIASVLAQTFEQWELVVVDDGSEDDTVTVVRNFGDPRVRVVELSHLGNIAAVRNAGVSAGSGAWICFLDSDDVWLPDKLEVQFLLLRKTGRRWTYGRFELMDDEGQSMPNKAGAYVPHSGWIARELLTSTASVNIGTLAIERTLFNELGGFDTTPLLNCREDYDFALRMALAAEGVAATELLLRVREHRGRTTHTVNGHEVTAYVYRHCAGLHPGREWVRTAGKLEAWHLTEAATEHIKKGQYRSGMRHLRRAIQKGDRFRHLLSALYRGIFAAPRRNR
jgi:glycosyltransferase involved in cell wall biosynthesis